MEAVEELKAKGHVTVEGWKHRMKEKGHGDQTNDAFQAAESLVMNRAAAREQATPEDVLTGIDRINITEQQSGSAP